MTYIILAAGKGARLHPLTLKQPKTLYKLDKNTTILQRMIRLIRRYDEEAEIVVVVGYMADKIENEVDGVRFIRNPFYEVTNSIASLWFAGEYLDRDNITIINGDIVIEEKLVRDGVCACTEKPVVYIDSSVKNQGDYNVQVKNDKILVMSKDLTDYHGEYAGITKLDRASAELLKNEMNLMVCNNMYDQWYENALVQMIFERDFQLFYQDIAEYKWTEVDCVSDMLLAKDIHEE